MYRKDFGIVFAVALTWLAGAAGAEESEVPLPEIGRQLINKLGCPNCHALADPAFTGLPRLGPDLRRLASKTNAGWTEKWIRAPRELRPTTWMPHLLEAADPEEVRSIVAYLWASSVKVDYATPPAGDPARGEELFNAIGCTGCHLRDAGIERHEVTLPYRLQGPNLIHLGSKVNAGWLFAWIKNPRQYAPETLMPNNRLSGQEVADLTAFLMSSRDPELEGLPFEPAAKNEIEAGREAIELYGCYGCHLIEGFENAGHHASEWDSAAGFEGHGLDGLPDFGLAGRELEALAAAVGKSLGEGDPALVEGRKLVTLYNCRGCHLIEGWGQGIRSTVDDPGMLPPNLRSVGSRLQPEWLKGYLVDPSISVQRPWLRIHMPIFGLSDEQIGILVDYFSALEEREVPSLPAEPLAARSVAVGREAFALMWCGRCHPASDEVAEALGIGAANLAPSLEIAHRRLRYGWIADWIKDPQGMMPGTKMPTFFSQSQPGVYESIFPDGLGDFPEIEARLMQHFASEEELDALVRDADAVVRAMVDYVWSLGQEEAAESLSR